MVSGVLGGIAEYFGIDSTLLRILFMVAVFLGVGSPIFLYVILAILIPEPKVQKPSNHQTNYEGYYKTKSSRKKAPKEAEQVKDDDWSDF